ncbi:MAG: phytoene/squalene synthase family protein [Pseudomonadota bacterium]
MSELAIQNAQANALETLKKHGKTFNFARLFLPKNTGNDAAVLYQFCRYVDDIVDEAKSKSGAALHLERINNALRAQDEADPMVGPFIKLCKKHQIPIRYGLHLVHGVSQDLSTVSITSKDELIRYAYYVAGVVGLMMAPILGADRKGRPYAVDLGIAMQLTNIARDVLEDAHNNRRYLPGDWIDNVSPQDIAHSSKATQSIVTHGIRTLLALAESYYESAFIGLNHLPLKSRIAINVAAVTYREIGRKLARNEYAFWRGRIVVPSWHKTLLAVGCLVSPDSRYKRSAIPRHHSTLHQPIKCIMNLN